MSSPLQFFDVIYLGIFIILSRALDSRFYGVQPPQGLDDEIASADSHFVSLIHYFGEHYITILDGVVIDSSYIVKRMLSEFAAAVVVFTDALDESQGGDVDMDMDDLEGEAADVIAPSKVKLQIDHIIGQSYPEVILYHRHCVATGHKHFIWTGPPVTILPRSEACSSIVGVLMSNGEQLDLPTWPIYIPRTPTTAPPIPMSAPSVPADVTKRRGSTNDDDVQAKKLKM